MAKFNVSSELERLGTFLDWSEQATLSKPVKPSALDLARAGFSYTGSSDEVRCFSCGLRVDGWEPHHDPLVVHATRSPQCQLVMGIEPANQPVFVPPEKEYIKIKAMLTELGKRATAAAAGASSLPYPNGSNSCLVADTLAMIYGDSMLSSSRQSPQPQGGASRRVYGRTSSSSSSPSSRVTGANAASSRSPSRSNRSGTTESRRGATSTPSPVSSSTSSPRRSSSTSEVNPENPTGSPQQGRPSFHRAHSYASPRARSSHGSDTVANRQTSLPSSTADHRLFRQSEEARLQTFQLWGGVRGTSTVEFARAGFIFIGPPDRVQCVMCQGILKNWNDNDSPIEEHRKHFPDCAFVKEYFSRPSATRSGPRHPNFKSESARRDSFNNWEMTRNPTPTELAQAGFFYAGHGDSVKCFHCDGGLRNWEPNDDPWREHARWFPKCGFVKALKGSAFISEVLNSCTEYQSASVDETEPKNVAAHGAAAQRPVDPREVTSRMDSAIVQAVLKMDIPRKLVKKAIKKQLSENGEDFKSAEALLEAVFNLDFGAACDEAEEAGELQDSALSPESGNSGDSSSTDSIRLMEENRQLKEQRQCKICMDEEVCVAFLPCGHLVCCATCAPALNACPICRAKIRGTVRTYMS